MNHSTNRKTKDKEAWRGKERLLPDIIWQLKTWVACISLRGPSLKGRMTVTAFLHFIFFLFTLHLNPGQILPLFHPPNYNEYQANSVVVADLFFICCKGNLLNPGSDSWLRDWPDLIRAPSSPPLFHFQLFYQGFPLPKTDIPMSNLCQIQTSHFLFNL